MPNLRNGSNRDSNLYSLDCESGILPVGYYTHPPSHVVGDIPATGVMHIGVRGGGAVDPPIRADMTFIRAKDKTFVREHSGKTGFDPPNGCWPVRR